jgi:hypothetical protein
MQKGLLPQQFSFLFLLCWSERHPDLNLIHVTSMQFTMFSAIQIKNNKSARNN